MHCPREPHDRRRFQRLAARSPVPDPRRPSGAPWKVSEDGIPAMIYAARNEAHGFRGESWAEGRKRREDDADDRCLAHELGSLCRKGGGAQSPRRRPHQEGVTETWVSVEMGESKTVPLASTRGGNLLIHRHSRRALGVRAVPVDNPRTSQLRPA